VEEKSKFPAKQRTKAVGPLLDAVGATHYGFAGVWRRLALGVGRV
jgi:hypothetical protein